MNDDECYRGADRDLEVYDTHQRPERLGVRAVTPEGRTALGGQGYFVLYREGLSPRSPDDRMGNQRPSARVLYQEIM